MDKDEKDSVKEKNPHEKHRERLRRRVMAEGLRSFEDHNILEFLLFFSVPRADTNIIAHRLIDKFGSLSGVFDADYNKLLEVEGIGPKSALLIKTMPEMMTMYCLDKVSKKTDFKDIISVAEYLTEYYKAHTVEECVMLMFDDKMSLIKLVSLSQGGNNITSVDYPKISVILHAHKATSFIIAHNHPYATREPSNEDINLTINLINIFEPIGIRLLEHIIISNDGYTFVTDYLLRL